MEGERDCSAAWPTALGAAECGGPSDNEAWHAPFVVREFRMTPEKKRRVATAVGFLSGVLACLDALRDARIFWPPDVVWEALRNPQRVELGGGIALIVVTLALTIGRNWFA